MSGTSLNSYLTDNSADDINDSKFTDSQLTSSYVLEASPVKKLSPVRPKVSSLFCTPQCTDDVRSHLASSAMNSPSYLLQPSRFNKFDESYLH